MADTALPILLDVISPETTLVHQMVDSVELPGAKGRFVILRSHAPLVSSLEKGEIRYSCGGDRVETLAISSGFVEVCDNKVTACVEI